MLQASEQLLQLGQAADLQLGEHLHNMARKWNEQMKITIKVGRNITAKVVNTFRQSVVNLNAYLSCCVGSLQHV